MIFAVSTASSQQVARSKLFRHNPTVAWSCTSSGVQALVYRAGMAVDADGAYRAYHPNNRIGLDSIEHAGHPGDWWALAADRGSANGGRGVPRKEDPATGYSVSMPAPCAVGSAGGRH